MDLAATVQRTEDFFIYFQICTFQNTMVYLENECVYASMQNVLQAYSFRWRYVNGLQNWELGFWVQTAFLTLAC